MVRIADLIREEESQNQADCQLIVSGDTSVEEVLAKMAEHGCEYVGVGIENADNPAILSKEDVLTGLLGQLDDAQSKLAQLKQQIEGGAANQLDLVQENIWTLAESEKNKLEIAIENMTEGLIILDQTGEVENANPSAKKLLGLDDEQGFGDLTKAIDRFGFRELMLGNDRGETNKTGELKVKAASGKILQMKWTQMVDKLEQPLGRVVVIRDVTDEVAAKNAKTEFIASISHELRTPLTSIQNSVSNMLAGVYGKLNKKTREYLHTMKSDCHRLAGLVNDLLDIAKLEAGSMPISRRVMNIIAIISDAIENFGQEAAKKDIELVCEIEGHISPVYADSGRIYQVVCKLVSNALKFTPQGGRVSIRSYDSGDNVVTVVEDTGMGISTYQQKEIFNKFYQISREAGPGFKGSGLGLAICNGLIAVHGGSIWVQSQEGQGSKFYFSLPKTDPFIVLYKHLGALAQRISKVSENFALIITNFDVPHEQRGSLKGVVGSLINEILTESDYFMRNSDDLAIQTEDFEAVFVVSGAIEQQIETVKQKFEKIVSNRLRKNCGHTPILPMFGVAVYPGDSDDIQKLEQIARGRICKMF